MKFIQMSLLASTVVLFTACGGVDSIVESFDPGDNDTYVPVSFTGQFVDTYVAGLKYTCTGYSNDGEANQLTGEGVTNTKGEFTCNEGDIVEFSLGSYVIGSTHAYGDPIVSPYNLSLGSESAIINLAQLLQTIDDKSIDGVLTIPDNFTALNDVTIKLDDPDFDALMADALPNVTVLVSEEVARAHLEESIAAFTTPTSQDALLREMLAGNTWYSAEPLTVTFNADVTIIEFDDGGTDTVSLDGMTLTHSEGTEVITIVNETTLVFSYNGVEEGVTFTLQAEPDATESALLREMLAGNTWESTDTTLTFNTDVTSVAILNDGGIVDDTVSLDGMTLTHSEGTEVITIVNETTLIFNTETFTLVPLT